jgi:stalled ribosome alternative rescue factor ArfA
MKNKLLSFTLKAPKVRAHQALFDSTLPFRGRVEQRKDAYKRKPKHPKKDEE